MREYHTDSPGKLLQIISQNKSPKLKTQIIDAMTTNETFWFRDMPHYDVLSKKIFTEYARKKKSIRIWSAACSSGQEAYSVSMLMSDYTSTHPGKLNFNQSIIATDISSTIIKDAKNAVYCTVSSSRGMPAKYLEKYFTSQNNHHYLNDEIKKRVQFKELNLTKNYDSLGKFDVIFCRNVLIYFSAEMKIDILNRIEKALSPKGYLFLGSSESLVGYSKKFNMISEYGAVYYQKK